MDYANLLYEVSGEIATITVNRPQALNALNVETVGELGVAFDEVANDENVRGVILTGSGDKSFVAGADIKELATLTPMAAKEVALKGQGVFSKIAHLDKPVIAAVNGFALGGGCELAMACHMRYAHSTAKFGQPEVNLGLIPGYGGTQRLPRLVGYGIALELLLSGDMIKADRAFQIGLVNGVFDNWMQDENGEPILNAKGRKQVDKEGFLNDVTARLNVILSKAPVAVRFALDAARRGISCTIDEGLSIESDLFGMVYTTEDSSEGLNAFLEKRKAEFKGK